MSRWRHQMVVIVGCLWMVAWTVPAARACDCAWRPSVSEALDSAALVFEGTVERIETELRELGEGLPPYHWDVAVFRARRFWKGEPRPIVPLGGVRENTCNYRFDAGEAYVVFASAYGDGSNVLTAGLCTLTQRADTAAEMLQALGEGQPVPQVSGAQ